MVKHRVRLPGKHDLDQNGRARIMVVDRHGRKKVRMATAVDAREIILAGSGTLDVPEDLARAEAAREERASEMSQYGLKELRGFCKTARIAFTGKPESELRRLLLEADFQPPEVDETNTVEVETVDEP
jgi:hypothetical protein